MNFDKLADRVLKGESPSDVVRSLVKTEQSLSVGDRVTWECDPSYPGQMEICSGEIIDLRGDKAVVMPDSGPTPGGDPLRGPIREKEISLSALEPEFESRRRMEQGGQQSLGSGRIEKKSAAEAMDPYTLNAGYPGPSDPEVVWDVTFQNDIVPSDTSRGPVWRKDELRGVLFDDAYFMLEVGSSVQGKEGATERGAERIMEKVVRAVEGLTFQDPAEGDALDVEDKIYDAIQKAVPELKAY